MGLMSVMKEGEDHYGNSLTGEPGKCTISGLAPVDVQSNV
jgi:hypothetical protein